MESLRLDGDWNHRALRDIADQAAFDLVERFGIVDASLKEPLKDWLAVCIRDFFDELLSKGFTKQPLQAAKHRVHLSGSAVHYDLRRLYSADLRASLRPFPKLRNRCARDIKQLSAILSRAANHDGSRPTGNASNPALVSLSVNIYDFCIPDAASRVGAIKITQSSKLFAFASYLYSVVNHRCDDRMVKERLRRAARSDAVRDARSRPVRALFSRLEGKRFNLDEGPPPGWNNSMSRK